MANRTTTNPMFIDTWTANVTLAAKDTPIVIRKIVMFSAAAGDKFALDSGSSFDASKNPDKQIFMSTTVTNSHTHEVDFGDEGWRITEGVIIDVSDCTGYSSGDLVWIYLK